MKIYAVIILFTASIISLSVMGKNQIPAGFESIAAGQHEWVDVRLYGRTLGLFEATISFEYVQFLAPTAIVQAIEADYSLSLDLQTLLMQKLSSSLVRHGDKACSSNGAAPGCDYLETKTLAIIYDENNARVNLFLNKDVVPQSDSANSPYYQASLETNNAFIHQQNLNFVAGKDFQTLSLLGSGALGITSATYLGIDWDYLAQKSRWQGNQQININNAFLRQELGKQHYIQAGRMDSRDIFSRAGGNISFNQLPLGNIEGLRIGSTLSWLNETKSEQGTPLTVFITRPSRVDAFRGQQLLGTFYLDAGAQQLDTRDFPNGSYSVTLQIYEDNRLTRSETLPFTRTGTSANRQTQWFLQGGQITDVAMSAMESQQDENKSIYQGGVKFALLSTAELTTGLALADKDSFWESVIDWEQGFDNRFFDGVMSSRVSYLKGSEGSSGNTQQVSYNDGFSLSFYRASRKAPDCDDGLSGQYRFSGCSQTSSLLFSVPLRSWYLNLGYTANRHAGRYSYVDSGQEQSGLAYQTVRTTQNGSRTQSWQGGVSRGFNFQGINMNASTNLFSTQQDKVQKRDVGAFAQLSFSWVKPLSASSLGMSYQSSRTNGGQLSYNGAQSWYLDAENQQELGVTFNGTGAQSLNSSAYGRTRGRYGNADLRVTAASVNHSLSSSGSYSSALALSRSGWYWGQWGTGQPAAAIGVRVDNPDASQNSHIDVAVDGVGNASVKGQGRALFAVPAYTTTQMMLNDSITATQGVRSEITQGGGQHSLFMAPGQLYVRKVQITSRYTYLGRLMLDNNTPLERATPLNVRVWSALGNGAFTLETDSRIKQLYLMRDTAMYRCAFIVQHTKDVVSYVGQSQCQPVELSSIPELLQQQAKIVLTRQAVSLPDTAKR
nr:TcfC E-set like domain-containing protein [Yersinia aleksiciae]